MTRSTSSAPRMPLDRLDPAPDPPGRMGRHVWFRTPTKKWTGSTCSTSTSPVSRTRPTSTPEAPRRDRADHERLLAGDDRPGLLDGADACAPRRPRPVLLERSRRGDDDDRVGNRDRSIHRPVRRRAIHAGHAAAGHVFMQGAESTRLSIKMRAARSATIRRSRRRSALAVSAATMARLVWALGAMAAERVFYGENSNGVGGDVQSATAQAAWMVGASATAPSPSSDAARRRERRRGAQPRAQALRVDRAPDHEPD